VSFTKKILETARSGLNSLMEKVSADGTPLEGIDSAALQAELEKRVAIAKERGKTDPADNPKAKWAGASPAAANKRGEIADKRERRIRGARSKKAKQQKRAADEAFRKIREQARRANSNGGARASASSKSGGSGRRKGFSGFGRDPKIAKYYKVLNLPYGSPFVEVKASYRKLMRKYHPDLHTKSPAKLKAATELSMQVTQAYNELESHLDGGPNKS